MFDLANIGLSTAINVFAAASNTAVVDAVLKVIHRSIEALTKSLSGAALILRGIFTNGVNQETLNFILNNLKDLFTFLYDLFRPSAVHNEDFPGGINPYNELDLRRAENSNAVIYQVQRVALMITAILKMSGEHVPPNGLSSINMNVSLQSDFDMEGNPPPSTFTSRLAEGADSPTNEKWLFINGIANELVWFQRSCDKLRDKFRREVKGVYNRSDGIIWDLVECAGERGVATPNALIERTQSSQAAQEMLERVLRETLWPAGQATPSKVVMIAHSQGCLILRLALQTLLMEGRNLKNLGVFTFGNPSIDWKVIMGGEQHFLSEYVAVTEHFAHREDYVAKLGVVTHATNGYDENSIFYSRDGKGHLFGAHYPLAAEKYLTGDRSKLLGAVQGNPIRF